MYVIEKEVVRQYYAGKDFQVVEIDWKNQERESGEPFDIEVQLFNGDKHFWEVKTTPSDKKQDFQITPSEFRFAMSHSEQYFIIRIQSGGTEFPNLFIIENPLESIKQGLIRVEDAKILIYQ